MKTFLTFITLAIAAPAAMAQNMTVEKAQAESLADIFETACMSYGTDVEGTRLFAHLNDLPKTDTEAFDFYNSIYGFTVGLNGFSFTYSGQTDAGLNYEINVNEFDQQRAERYYGCSIASQQVTLNALEAEIRTAYRLPDRPVVDLNQIQLHHRMWQLGDETDSENIILIGMADPDQPLAVIAYFSKEVLEE